MEIEDTPVYKEVTDVIDDGPKPVYYHYMAQIHTPEDDYDAMKLVDIQQTCDYIGNAADEVRVTVVLPLGLWAKSLYAHRTELEITIIKEPLVEMGDAQEEEREIQTKRYIAIPNPEQMPVIEGRDLNKLLEVELDILDIFNIEFQLHDKVAYQARLITCGGTFRRITGERVVKYLLAKETKEKTTQDDESSFLGVDMIESNNKDEREHILLPNGTNLFDIPVYIQKYAGGLYSTGIGSYYHDRHWFVYPLWDTERYERATKTLKIVKVPTTRYTAIERTYRQEGDTVYMLATSNSEIKDDNDTNFIESGNGTRFADSRRFIRDFVEIKDNKAVAKREKNNHEFLSVDRGVGRNTVYTSNKRINANPYVERSTLASRKGRLFHLIWENSDPTLLFPAMMCKIHYFDSNEIKELNGVLLACNTAVQLAGIGVTSRRHNTTTQMLIFANSVDEGPHLNSEDEKNAERWTQYETI